MELYKAAQGRILIAVLSGELDHHSAAAVRKQIDTETASYDKISLILDMTQVTFMDSSGIGVVLGRYRNITEQGGQVLLAGCNGYVEKILSMAGIFKVIHRVQTAEEGIAQMQRGASFAWIRKTQSQEEQRRIETDGVQLQRKRSQRETGDACPQQEAALPQEEAARPERKELRAQGKEVQAQEGGGSI